MDRLKSILKTLGFWLVFVIIAILGFLALIPAVKLNSVLNWVLVGITLLALIFLFIMRRRLFKIPPVTIIVLAVLWLICLMFLLFPEGNSSGNAKLTVIYYLLPIVMVFYFLGAYLITKQRLLKIVGVLLILATSFINARFITMPDYSILTMMLSVVVWALMMGMGIFIVTRKGIGLRLLGIGLIIATMSTVFMVIFSYSSLTAVIIGKDRMMILAGAEPQINDLFQAWDDKDYQKFSKDFSDEMKGKLDRDAFLSNRDKLGKLISKDGLRKLAPTAVSPTVTTETMVIHVTYMATFEKHPAVIYAITFDFLRFDNKYLIRGLTFDPLDLSTIEINK